MGRIPRGMKSRKQKPKFVTIEVFQGLVNDVKGLPEGYRYKVKDLDAEKYA